jgi:hypothetical protein
VKKAFLPVIIGVFAFFCAIWGAENLQEKKIFLSANSTADEPIYTFPGGKKMIYKTAENLYVEYEIGVGETNLGIHCYPLAVQFLDEERYVVIDLINVKVMKGNVILKTLENTNIGYIEKLYFDDFENIYFKNSYRTGDRFFNLKVTKNNTISFDEIPEIPPKLVQKQVKNALGEVVLGVDFAQKSLNRATGDTIEISNHDIILSTDASYFKILNSTHANWKANLYGFNNRENVFMRASAGTVLFEFPNSIRPIAKLTSDTNLQIITTQSGLSLNNILYGAFDFAYVLHPFYGPIYVENSVQNPLLQMNFSISNNAELGFDAQNTQKMARTLLNNVPIYRFPTAVYPLGVNERDLVIKYLPRNFELTDRTHDTSLQVLRKITIPDRVAAPRYYFEVRLDADGTPSRTGEFVGYIDEGLIIDSYRGLSDKRINTNAKIVLSSGTAGVSVWYYDENGVLCENENEKLYNGDRIQVIGKLNDRFTHVLFVGFDESREGYIETKYIVNDGINPWQIVAAVSLMACIATIAWIVVRRYSRARHAANCAMKS